jgi:MFS transporter, DHA3 family, tetracycline resistance protein
MHRLKPFSTYLIMTGTDAVSRNTMYVLLAVYYVLIVHMSPLQLVLVGTALEASYFLVQLPTGAFADTHSRKLSIVLGLFMTGACFVVEGLVPLFAAIIGAEIVRGVGEAFFDGADQAWLADELGQERLGPALLRGAQIGQAGAIIGTIAAVALGSIHLNVPVVAGGIALMGLSAFLLLAMPEDGFRPAPRIEVSRLQVMRATLRTGVATVRAYPILLAVVAAELFLGGASEGFDRLWEAHLLRDIHLPGIGALQPLVWFGLIAVGTGLLGIGAGQLFNRWLAGFTRTLATAARALAVLQILSIAVIVVFAFAGNLALALAALAMQTLIGTMRHPIKGVWVNASIPDSNVRATVLSIISGSNAIGQTAGGPPIGAVGNIFSLRAAIGATGLIMAPVVAIYAWAAHRSHTQPAPAREVDSQAYP